jgi:hypothetical protein
MFGQLYYRDLLQYNRAADYYQLGFGCMIIVEILQLQADPEGPPLEPNSRGT